MSNVKPWRVTASRITYADSWLTVRSDDCETEAGERIAPYHVLQYPDFVNVVAVGLDGQLVLVRQYRHGIGAILTELPCGIVEEQDDSATAAAERELFEETGMGALHALEVCRLPVNPANHSNHVTTVAILCEPRAAPRDMPGETLDVVRVPFGTFLASVLSRTIALQASHVSSLLLAHHAMRSNSGFARIAAKLVEARA